MENLGESPRKYRSYAGDLTLHKLNQTGKTVSGNDQFKEELWR